MKKKQTIDIRESILHMERENLVIILQTIYDEYPTIRHSMYLAFIKAIKQIGEENDRGRKKDV